MSAEMIGVNRLFGRVPHRLVLAILLLAGVLSAGAQEPKTLWVPRNEMIGAIIGFATSQCGKLNELLPELFEAHCKDPTGGFVVLLMARAALASRSDAALQELCRKHGISECQTQREMSRGQPILVPDISVAVSPHIASWSPDNRFLLFQDGGLEPRILDAASGQLVDKALQKRRAKAFAWSPDGKLAAITSFGGLRVLSVGSWEEVGTAPPPKEGCRWQGQRYIAFTADSRSLWVLCTNHFSPQARVAQKLSIPDLQAEDDVLISPPPGVGKIGFQAVAIARHADDLIVTGTLYQYDEAGKPQAGGGLTALSLKRKLPVYRSLAAHSFIRHADDLSRILLHRWRPTGAADKHGNAPGDRDLGHRVGQTDRHVWRHNGRRQHSHAASRRAHDQPPDCRLPREEISERDAGRHG
jgi:hypothetical protein